MKGNNQELLMLYYDFYNLIDNNQKYKFILNNISNNTFKINWSNLLKLYK